MQSGGNNRLLLQTKALSNLGLSRSDRRGGGSSNSQGSGEVYCPIEAVSMLWKRRSLGLPLVVMACALLGGVYGPKLEPAAAAAETGDLHDEVGAFTRAYAAVSRSFADPVSADKAIYKGAIPGMLRTLDPHSTFFDPRDYKLLREDQKGHYFGVGMQVGPRGGKTVVISPFPGSPSYKAGLRPGDTIIAVDGKPTDGLTTTEVADLLKGPRGTTVVIKVSREGSSEPLNFTVMRDEIIRKSVQDALWIQPGIAYVKILSFAESTSRELDDNLRRLGEANIKGMILDLRDNPGGLLNEGVAVADRFLKKNQVIVSHKGRTSSQRSYAARNGSRGREYPIVVLVNGSSASAAEIVSGALQDHDRAWILGETTFGKGLVQTVYPLSENTGLALTTAHFYTPSGRLIQRDYSQSSFFNYYNRKDDGTRNWKDVKMTDSGRTVYGGGGITPDEKYEAPKLTRLELALAREGLFNFTRSYFGTHSTHLPEGWKPGHDVMEELHDYLLEHGAKFSEAEFTADYDWIRRNLTKEMYTTAFDVDIASQVFAQTDPEVQRAVDALPKAVALIENAKRVIVQRTSPAPADSGATVARPSR
jgi:carboxyl-terminal processing protease